MPHFRGYHRLDSRDQIDRQTEHAREITRRSLEILQQPMPDTFLGRKTQEPFPGEEEAPRPERPKA